MAEEVAGSPKPDRSDVSPPKVLVQQASEDKGDGNMANDTATANGSAEHNLVNGEVSQEETKEKPPQPSPETGESSGHHQAKSNDVQGSPEPEEPEVRETESSSKLSIHSEGSGTVVEHETTDLAASSSASETKLEELKKEKESEMESLNERIAELRSEINRLEGEKETEHRKVDELSLQIKRMTNDNADNVKTIQNLEEKIKTLKEENEKYKRQEQNGTTSPVVPSQPPKKSSVCVIL